MRLPPKAFPFSHVIPTEHTVYTRTHRSEQQRAPHPATALATGPRPYETQSEEVQVSTLQGTGEACWESSRQSSELTRRTLGQLSSRITEMDDDLFQDMPAFELEFLQVLLEHT